MNNDDNNTNINDIPFNNEMSYLLFGGVILIFICKLKVSINMRYSPIIIIIII